MDSILAERRRTVKRPLLNRGLWHAGALLPLLFLSLFFFIPVLLVLRQGLQGEAGLLSLQGFRSILGDPYYRRVLVFTLLQALASLAAAFALGLPGAYLLAHYNFPGKKVVRAVTMVPFVLPPILVVLGFVLTFGNNGVINRLLMALTGSSEPPLRILYSFRAIILAHAFYNFPICIRIVSAGWEQVSRNQQFAARSLGASPTRTFFTVTLPQLGPSLFSAGALIFLFCFMSFAVILVLGGDPRYTTIEVEIYRLARIGLDMEKAGSLALMGSLLSALFMYAYIHLQRSLAGRTSHSDTNRPLLKKRLTGFKAAAALPYTALLLLLIATPLVMVLVNSLQSRSGWSGDGGWTLRWYRELFSGGAPLRAVRNSLQFALATALLSLPLGTLAAYIPARSRLRFPRLYESIMMLPLGLSSVILGLGYLKSSLLFSSGVIPARVLLILAHTVIAFPFVLRSVSAGIQTMSPSLREASRSLGAGPWETFVKVELPLLKSGLIGGAAFAFALSIGEMNAALLITGGEAVTIPIAIYRLTSSYNFYGACAMGTVLMVFCTATFLLIEGRNGTRSLL